MTASFNKVNNEVEKVLQLFLFSAFRLYKIEIFYSFK